jgi:hypothetical protein
MQAADRANFARGYGVMAEMFNEPVSATKIEAYFSALSDLPYEDVERAIRVVMQEARFFPRPIELREAVRGNPEQRAEERWGKVVEAVRRVGYMGQPVFDDPLVSQAIDRLWGSWGARRLDQAVSDGLCDVGDPASARLAAADVASGHAGRAAPAGGHLAHEVDAGGRGDSDRPERRADVGWGPSGG